MPVIDLNEENLAEAVEKGGIVLVDCWASWCGACATFAPVYEQAAERHPDCTFGKIDTEAEKDLTSALSVENIPTLLIYRDGILLFRQPGTFDEDQLEKIVHQAESIDMDKVRIHIAAEASAQSEQAG